MKKRIEYLEEMIWSMCIGGGITLLALAAIHHILTAGELVAFWMGGKAVMTYAVWTIILLIKERGKDNVEADD